jgi:hypothetical protein
MSTVHPAAADQPPALPFGKHRGVPLYAVPADYLRWALTTCKLSSGLRTALAAELSRRGLPAPDPPAFTVPPCPEGCRAGYRCGWQQDRAGRRRVRAECAACGRFLTFPPSRPPYSAEADAAASETAVLDVLTQAEAAGARLCSDGATCWVHSEDSGLAPAELLGRIRQCAHRLAGLMGKGAV